MNKNAAKPISNTDLRLCADCLFRDSKEAASFMRKNHCVECPFKYHRFGHKHKIVMSFSLEPENVADLGRRSSNRSMALDFAISRYVKLIAGSHRRLIAEMGQSEIKQIFRLLKHYPTVNPHPRGHARTSHDDSPLAFDERERVLRILSHSPKLASEVAKLDDLLFCALLDLCERFYMYQTMKHSPHYE